MRQVRMTGAQRAAAVLMASWGFVASAFVVGATFAAPGGAAAWGLTLVWMIPLGLLVWSSVERPYGVDRVLLGTAVLAVAAWLAFVLEPVGMRHLMDRVGPVVSIANVLASVPAGLLGLERPRFAGSLLFVAATVPLATMAVGADEGLIHAAMIAAIPNVAVGTLFMLAWDREPDAALVRALAAHRLDARERERPAA